MNLNDHKYKMIGLAAALVIGGLAFLIYLPLRAVLSLYFHAYFHALAIGGRTFLIYPELLWIVAVIAVLAFVLIKVSQGGWRPKG